MRRRLVLWLAVVALIGVSAAPAIGKGHTTNFRTHLKGANEVPSVATNAQGQATFKLSTDGSELHYKLIVANIENVTQAHIHVGGADVNGPVATFLYGFELIPGRFQGVLAEGTITDSDVFGMSLAELVDEIRAGNTYVNVHTTQKPGGEIRGQIG